MTRITLGVGIVVVSLMFVGGAIYWFAIRPANIKKDCAHLLTSTHTLQRGLEEDGRTLGTRTPEQAELNYQRCLAEQGP